MRTRAKPFAAGFTLLELLFVVVIMSIMTAMAVPVATSIIANYRMQAVENAIKGAIQTARYQAISSGFPFAITFNKTTLTYQVTCSPTYNPAQTGNTWISTSQCGSTTNYYNSAVPFSTSYSAQLDNTYTFYMRPGGAVQTADNQVINCSASAGSWQMTLSYPGLTNEVITVGCYGDITIAP
jgi:prepilin-type N-terminal cleavage/methylation domain-containing protein